MQVDIIARPLCGVSHVPAGSLRLLADALRESGMDVVDDTCALPTADLLTSVSAAGIELAERWAARPPDVVHAIGIVAAMAAVEAAQHSEQPIAVLATFDESPAADGLESDVARHVTAVLPLSRAERHRWRRMDVPTRWSGPFPVPIPLPGIDLRPRDVTDVVTFSGGPDLDRIVDSMPYWSGRLIVCARLAETQRAGLRERSISLGVNERVFLRPGPREREREDTWAAAAVLVACTEGSRHGSYVLEAAAHGVPSVATAVDAHLDTVVGHSTGLLLDPDADARTLGLAVALLASDRFGLRALGASARARISVLHAPSAAGERLLPLYREVAPGQPPVARTLPAAHGSATNADLAAARRRHPSVAPVPVRDLPAMAPDPLLTELVLAQLPLARGTAGGRPGRGQGGEDPVPVAPIDPVLALERFEPSHGTHFRGDTIPDNGPGLAADLVDLRQDLRRLLAQLPEREQRILLMRFLADLTPAEIAALLDISQAHVSRILTKTLATLQDHLLREAPLPGKWHHPNGPARAGPPQPDPVGQAPAVAPPLPSPRPPTP